MVVPLVLPRTSRLAPFFTALAELDFVPLRYFVEDDVVTVTF